MFPTYVEMFKTTKNNRSSVHPSISAPNFKSHYMFVVAGGTEKLINQRM